MARSKRFAPLSKIRTAGDGRICGCFSPTLDEYEATFHLIVADRGRFRFTPSGVRSNLLASRTTTQLLPEAQLRRDLDRRDSSGR